jgi:hypothetical protein
VVIEEGPNDFLQYYIYSYQNPDPPYENHLIIYAAKVVAGVEEVIPGTDIEIFVTAPMYIRVARNGTWWTLSYSDDGTTWNALPSFDYAITATKVGIAIGAEVPDTDPPPGFTGSIDYFQNNDVPIDPHD